ncbi:hypothetical protein FIBSPDRAFT_914423 [Athelia psychrophila]|uniref:Uncharacterized protein n=1 Tax=Athelia psychrophila TaxID=1759441 RepID=A0A165WME5_9AGAM|nr:hypothetical protein FIBSPDRAFT_914423 [Fibularhizoctonia sp. CBS 109695]
MSAMFSNLSTLTLTSDATIVSQYTPDEYKKTSYYNSITRDGDHPELVYHSDFLTTLFSKPVGRHTHIPVKSLCGVFDTPINWSSVDPACFFTHGPPGEEKGSLSPTAIWVGVIPGSTSSNTTHKVSQEILALLLKNGVEDVAVEWHEAVPQRLAGPPLMHHVGSDNATHYVCRFLTAILGIPLVIKGMEEEDAQGTLTLWFHKNRNKDGNPSDKVYRVSNCHVLRKDTTRGLDEIKKAQEIIKLEVKERKDAENMRLILNEAIADLEALCNKVTKYWSDIELHCNIGLVHWMRSKYSPQDLTAMFYPLGGGVTTFKLRIEGRAIKEDLANPIEFDSEGQHCLIVGEDNNTTNLTIRHYTSLVSFTLSGVGIKSIELSIYNLGVKNAKAFSAKGDSGSLVWPTKKGKACIIGQLHSGNNKGGSTSNHVTYCTPGCYFLDQIRKKFKYTTFYCTTWSAPA